MIEEAVEEITPIVGTRPACRALGAAPGLAPVSSGLESTVKVRCAGVGSVQHGLGLAVQQQAVVDHCRREDVELVESFEDPRLA